MNKIPFLLLFALISLTTFAQSKVSLQRVEASIGFFTLNDQYLSDYRQPTYAGTDWGYGPSSSSFFAGVGFYSYKRLEIALEAGFQQGTLNQVSVYDNQSMQYINESVSFHAYTFMPRLRLNWIQSSDGIFELYSSLNIGLTFADMQHSVLTSENGFYPSPAGQLCLLGMRFGKEFGGFFEMGPGSKGLINFGISYRPKS